MVQITQAATQQLYAFLLGAFRVAAADERAGARRDRGALSLEQVLWFVAAGVSVAVIAAILWNRIAGQADENDNIQVPSAPTLP